MSDYMFMLDSHLSPDQSRVVAEVQGAAAQANVNVFLTGGAMRDMLGGFPIRDLDFTVEGNALKLAKTVAQKTGAKIAATDDNRKSADLVFKGGVTAEIGMARQERYAKPGGKPHVQPATIHEDLRGRDFTVNSIALSLNRASRGLLLDPNNGLGDLDRKELRAVSNYTLYDDPARLLRLLRLQVRMSYALDERTKLQYENVREAQMETRITPASLYAELQSIADEPLVGDVVKRLDEEKLLTLFSSTLAGAKLNLPGLQKLQKARQLVPFGVNVNLHNFGLFLFVLTEKLNAKERTSLIKGLGLTRHDVESWQKLEAKSKKLDKELRSPKLQKASLLYAALCKVPGEQLLFLLLKSTQRIVQDRIRNYFQKYLPAAQEITDKDVLATGVQAGSPKFAKVREELIATRLDARPKKIPPPEEPPPPTGPMGRGRPPGPSPSRPMPPPLMR